MAFGMFLEMLSRCSSKLFAYVGSKVIESCGERRNTGVRGGGRVGWSTGESD